MKLKEYEQIMRTGTPSDRARAIAAASNDKELSEEEFHQLTALIKGAVRPHCPEDDAGRSKALGRGEPGEHSAEAGDGGSQLYGAGLAGRLAGGRHQHPLQDCERDAGRSELPDGGDWGTVIDRKQCIHVFEITRPGCLICAGRDEKCREYKEHEEEQDEPHDRA